MKKYTVRYMNGKNVLCSRKVEAHSEIEAINKLIRQNENMGNKVNKIIGVM